MNKEYSATLLAAHRHYKGDRESNFELLRIIAMLLVLITHADFFSLQCPSRLECQTEVIPSLTRFFFQASSSCCVSIFILISGWFGIKPSIKSFTSFVFQCLYFLLSIYIICLLIGIEKFSVQGLAANLLFVKDYDYWFIKSYICLYIISPILNSFIDNCERKTIYYTLVSFFLFQTIYGWVFPSASFFESGYSVVYLLGLYLLARYCRIYAPKITQISNRKIIFTIFSIVILLTVVSYMCVLHWRNISGLLIHFGSYLNPLVILISLLIVIIFGRLKFHSKAINYIASSCFGVYLFHTHISLFRTYFRPTVQAIYNSYDSFECLIMIGGFILLVFITAILFDQPRKIIWNFVNKRR